MTVWVNVQTRVFHSADTCPVAQRTAERRIQRQDGDGSDITKGLRCQICHTRTGAPR